ncbi:MAG: N-acetylneuraminate synthase [Candidatus Omnitrophica bacterium]|nr:N-acetylneuraminate synthase [Candidatus Omnitrophota bacterium]
MAFSKSVQVGPFTIGQGHPVFIIAEAGVNHNGDIKMAKRLIDAAKAAGADSVKFQTFKAENLNTRAAPKSTYHVETTGKKGSWFDLLKTQELDRKAHQILIEYCRKKKILFLSTPYDEESADLLDELGVAAFKIASTDANNIPLLKHLAKKKKPILLSTAMCTLVEVRESVQAIAKAGCHELVLFHCTANYPTQLADCNLRAMATLAQKFGVPVGYSDHVPNVFVPVAAVALGALSYEKHFTLDRNLPGPDHRASLEPQELAAMVQSIRQAEVLLGNAKKKSLACEIENRIKLRKSLVARRDIQKGERISVENLCVKRPAKGLDPIYFEKMLGRRVKRDIRADDFIFAKDVM